MPVLTFLLQGVTLGLSAAAQPGPFQAYLLSQALKLGARRALPLALAPLLSDGPIIALVLFVLVQMPAWLVRGLQVVGGLFLLYLAYGAFQAARQAVAVTADPEAARPGLVASTVMNLLNPNPYIFWSLAGGPILITSWGQSPGHTAVFLGAFYLTFLSSLASLIVLFAAAHRADARLTRALNLAAAVALLGFGLFQLWQGLLGGGG